MQHYLFNCKICCYFGRRKTGYEFLANIAPNVVINIYKVNEVITSEVNFIISITEKCKYHQSIKVIKTHMEKKDKPNFRFNEITKSIVVKEIKKLNPRKTSLSNDISKKLIKEFCHINILLLTILTNA